MFDSSIIFQRTQAGRDEIQQKSHGLTQSERLVLIMVDGASTYQQVRSKLPVLADERFERAVRNLQKKELILEVFLPIAGQEPEELERTVIDRFLQQDPLDPVTIMLRDPEEELGIFAQPVSPAKPTQPQATFVAPPVEEFSPTDLGAPTIRVLADSTADELNETQVEQLVQELKARPPARPPRRERKESAGSHASRHSDGHMRETHRSSAASNWGYLLIVVGLAFIAGYLLARVGA